MAKYTRRSFLGTTLLGIAGATSARSLAADDAPAGEPVAPPPPPATVVSNPGGSDQVPISFTLNGSAQTANVGADDTALQLVRSRGLTGSKEGCGAGTCGACTMLVDGVSHVSCLLPATALHGRAVTTVEGLGGPEIWSMHPVQRAMMAKDALQCGYCTPGFAVEAAAFHDRWRTERGTTAPSRDEVAAGLAGHLCRCGAYENLYEAVIAACIGAFDATDVVFPRIDAPEKVSGQAKYTVDIQADGMLEAAFFRSPHAHARLASLDDRPARALPGVKGIFRFLADGGRVRYAGQEVAAVAAVDRATALAAVRAIVAQWEVLPAAIGMESAIKPGAPVVYPTRKDTHGAPSSSEGPSLPASWENNLRGPSSSSVLARPRAGRKGVDDANSNGHVAGGVFRTAVQLHTALEPHAAVARWPTPDSIELWASTQAVKWLGEDVADRFDVDKNKVTVHAGYVGGGFGAKVGLQMEGLAAIELARLTNAPVRVALDRAEELTVGGNRPATQVEVALGMATSGTLMGVTQTAYSDSGCAVGNNLGIMTRLIYDTKNKDLDDYDIVTHEPPGKPMRGPAGPPNYFALESAVDAMAIAASEDPIELRRRWDPNAARNKLYDWVVTLPVYTDRGPAAADTGRFRRGVGVAAGAWFDFWDPHTQVELEVGPSGIVARCAAQDTGQGSRTVLATAVAEALGVDLLKVKVEIGENRLVHGPASAGSRSTASLVPAAQDAAARLIAELVDLAHERGLGSAAVTGGIQGASGVIPWTDVVAGTSGVKVIGRRRRDDKAALVPFALLDTKVGRVLPGVVNVTQVEVDTRLGRVRVIEGWAGVGVGRIVCEPLARNQILGAFIQNVGYALYEERRLDPTTGRLVTHNLDDYRIPGIGDSAPCTVHFEQGGFEHVRGGAVGLGEIGGVAVAGSIANAFTHATGKRPYRLPLKPETVLEVLS